MLEFLLEMDDIKKIFHDKLKKTGVALTGSQLWQYAKKSGIRVTRDQINKFISRELTVARFAPVRKPKQFQTISVLRPGVFFLDYAEFRPDLKHLNGGKTGFLVGVQNVTNQLYVTPCGNKTTESWLKAVESFVEHTQNVR